MLLSLPGLIMGFREGLEVFLVIGIIIHYLRKLNRQDLIRFVGFGSAVGIALSISLGFGLSILGQTQANTEFLAKVWKAAPAFSPYF